MWKARSCNLWQWKRQASKKTDPTPPERDQRLKKRNSNIHEQLHQQPRGRWSKPHPPKLRLSLHVHHCCQGTRIVATSPSVSVLRSVSCTFTRCSSSFLRVPLNFYSITPDPHVPVFLPGGCLKVATLIVFFATNMLKRSAKAKSHEIELIKPLLKLGLQREAAPHWKYAGSDVTSSAPIVRSLSYITSSMPSFNSSSFSSRSLLCCHSSRPICASTNHRLQPSGWHIQNILSSRTCENVSSHVVSSTFWPSSCPRSKLFVNASEINEMVWNDDVTPCKSTVCHLAQLQAPNQAARPPARAAKCSVKRYWPQSPSAPYMTWPTVCTHETWARFREERGPSTIDVLFKKKKNNKSTSKRQAPLTFTVIKRKAHGCRTVDLCCGRNQKKRTHNRQTEFNKVCTSASRSWRSRPCAAPLWVHMRVSRRSARFVLQMKGKRQCCLAGRSVVNANFGQRGLVEEIKSRHGRRRLQGWEACVEDHVVDPGTTAVGSSTSRFVPRGNQSSDDGESRASLAAAKHMRLKIAHAQRCWWLQSINDDWSDADALVFGWLCLGTDVCGYRSKAVEACTMLQSVTIWAGLQIACFNFRLCGGLRVASETRNNKTQNASTKQKNENLQQQYQNGTFIGKKSIICSRITMTQKRTCAKTQPKSNINKRTLKMSQVDKKSSCKQRSRARKRPLPKDQPNKIKSVQSRGLVILRGKSANWPIWPKSMTK